MSMDNRLKYEEIVRHFKREIIRALSIAVIAVMAVTAVGVQPAESASSLAGKTYKGAAVVKINKNKPKFTKKQKKLRKPKVTYSKLDKYGR